MPKKFRHFLGTDGIWKRFSSRINSWIKNLSNGWTSSMGIASIIGIILGALAGFFGDTKLKMPRIKYWLTILVCSWVFFMHLDKRKYELGEAFGESVQVV